MKSIIALAFAMLISVPSFASISVSPSNVMFGFVKVNGYSFNQKQVIVRNTGKQAVNLQVSGYCPPEYQVSNGCYSLSSGGSCSINITYRPSRPGTHSCNISVRDSTGASVSVYVTGTGTR